jgi:cytochrome c oxidase subunit II
MRKKQIGISACAVALLWSVGWTRAERIESQSQVIDMTAKKYEFTPSTVHVKAGSKLVLNITATDRPHGFRLPTVPDGAGAEASPGLVLTPPSPKDCYRLEKGQQLAIAIEAKTPGTYTFKCCVHCGLGHGGMKGQLIVDPQ